VKYFNNHDFGYHKGTVESPLRLAAQFTPEGLAIHCPKIKRPENSSGSLGRRPDRRTKLSPAFVDNSWPCSSVHWGGLCRLTHVHRFDHG
jgi:hypothetical protein